MKFTKKHFNELKLKLTTNLRWNTNDLIKLIYYMLIKYLCSLLCWLIGVKSNIDYVLVYIIVFAS